MKRIFQAATAFMVSLAMLAAPLAEAQTRGRGGHTSSGQSQSAPARNPGNQSRPSGNHGGHNRPQGNNNRPQGNKHNRPANPGRPSRPQQPGGNRPGGNRPDINRPDMNRPGHGPGAGNHRPDFGHGQNNYRPDHGYRPEPGHGPGHGPGYNRPGYHRPPTPPRPPRHHGHGYRHPVPFFGAYHRPVPPPRWRYVSGGPVFGTILGITLGTAINASINALINDGYTVSSYGNDVVYLSDVPQMNFYWPDAALYYNGGRLYGSQFTYTTPYYDMGRYNSLYNTFCMQYGAPVQTTNNPTLTSATWYGAGGRYVTLSFNSGYSGQYYTTLSFGN